ncbi:MAG: flagellar hook-basal body protein [Sulfuricurvum sp.]|jgi:flagellar basal-body rod protein FlgG|uniref:flagellar hook-basal body protein n=1 Tax=Sulfuricurvum sp. TaxID=2025608 RepID=UPI00260FFC31|nr:flagellar hook-basal body protein [Sulfuricurvum sp.]MDD3595173.1 flagellar hook-basal body protein [Sulfuricurvum sp.]MDD4883619.1 flagellar hook-basal body protein [Sulfuricurvum sp.]
MQTGYYAATAGMVAQFNRMDTIASNLANANTAGYKRDQLITGDFVRLFKNAQSELPIANQTEEAAQYLNRSLSRVPQISDAYTDYSLGSMQKTENTLDVAIGKEGQFFAVNTPNGVRLTRDGSFTINGEGKLVNKQGYEVLSADYFQTKTAITFTPQDAVISIDKNGQISTNVPGSTQMVAGKKLMIIEPQNIRMLKKEGDNLYIPDSADPLTPLAESGGIMQGFVEKSNVNAVNEMVALVEANRLVGMYQKAMDAQMNDLNSDAIQKIASKN